MGLKDLENDIKSLSKQAQDVVSDDALAITDKREKVEQIEADIKAKIEERDNLKYLEEKRAEFARNTDPETVKEEQTEARSLGEQFVQSSEYRSWLEDGGQRNGKWTTGAVDLKATMSTSASAVVQPQVLPGVTTINLQPPRVADLMPNGQTTSSTVRHLSETTATNAADTVAEAAAKPESTLILDEVDEPVRKIATLLPVTDEMLEDVAQIRSYIDSRLGLFVQIAEDDQLLNGTGVAPDLTGFLNRAGLQAAQALGADTRPDAIYKQVTNIRSNSFLEPDGLVVNPADWQDIRLAKDSTGQYFGPGPFDPDGELRLWGLNVVVTSRIAAGTALVGAFRTAAQVWRRGGITVEATNSHGTNFANNITTIRAETRLALAVYRPGAFGTVTGL